MDLELATTVEIVNELRNRGMRFVMIGVENSNRRDSESTFVAGQASCVGDIFDLLDLARAEFQQRGNDWIESGCSE